MKLNSHGQVLVIFVLILPVLLLFVGTVISRTTLTYEKNKLDNINNQVIEEYIDEETIISGEIIDYILKNDDSIVVDTIEFEEDYIRIKTTKMIDSYFTNIIGEKYFKVVSEIKRKR